MLIVILTILKSILFADLISGIGHWLEDRYARIGMTLIEKSIVLPNIEHHKTPRSFLARSYWQRNDIPILLAAVFLLTSFMFDFISPTLILTTCILSQINEIHAMAHRKKSENWKIVSFCQRFGLLQSGKHHNLHHSSPFEVRYCILTNYLNPILDKIKIFRFLEWIFFKIFNIRPNSQ